MSVRQESKYSITHPHTRRSRRRVEIAKEEAGRPAAAQTTSAASSSNDRSVERAAPRATGAVDQRRRRRTELICFLLSRVDARLMTCAASDAMDGTITTECPRERPDPGPSPRPGQSPANLSVRYLKRRVWMSRSDSDEDYATAQQHQQQQQQQLVQHATAMPHRHAAK